MPELDLSYEDPTDPEVTDAAGASSTPADELGPPPDPFGAPDLDELGPPQVTEATVRGFLLGASSAAAMLMRDHPANHDGGPMLWSMTAQELDSLTPVLTRMANDRPALARVIQRGDAAQAGIILATYAGRNVGRMRAAAAELEADAPGHDTGAAVAPGPVL